MRTSPIARTLVLTAALAAPACGPKAPERPSREAVTALLRQEADSLKRDGEKLDPVLRVKATWTVEGIDISERPSDPDKPWAGTIRFRIKSETKDTDGKVETDEFEKRFDYVYTASVNRWVFQLSPS
jgi:hypothetical protein